MPKENRKTKCRACRGKTQKHGYFYRCVNQKCLATFWHRAVLKKNLSNKEVFAEILKAGYINESKGHYIYVILLSRLPGESKNSVYVGLTGKHPNERYLNHLRGHKSGAGFVKKYGKTMLYYEGPMSYKKADKREREHADELRKKNNYQNVYGPGDRHLKNDPMDQSIYALGLSERDIKRLYNQKVKTVGDFLDFDVVSMIFHNPGVGKNSFKEISEKIDETTRKTNNTQQRSSYKYVSYKRKPKISEFSRMGYPISVLDFKKTALEKIQSHGIHNLKDLIEVDIQTILKCSNPIARQILQQRELLIKNKGFEDITFESIVNANIKGTKHKKDALLRRLSGELTLEKTGELLDQSRQRIQQLQEKIVHALFQKRPLFFAELKKISLNRTEPIYIWCLELEVDFFKGISRLISYKKSPLLRIFKDDDCPLKYEFIEKYIVFYNRESPSMQEIIVNIEQLDLKDKVGDYLSAVGRSEIYELVNNYFETHAPRSQAGKTREFLKTLFKQTDSLHSIKDLQAMLHKKYDTNFASNVISNALSEFPDVYQFSKKGWGRESEFGKLDEVELNDLSDLIVEKLVADDKESIYLDNILDEIDFSSAGINQETAKSITAFDLNWVLKKTKSKFPELQDQGRRYWSYGTTNQERVAVNILVSKFLKKSGKPMHISEIIKAIEEVRGISTTFQLRPSRSNKDLVMIDRELWGLRERDLEISEEEENTIIQKILDKFTSGLAYVFDYELSEIMLDVGLKQSVTLFQVSRLLYSYLSTNRDYSEYFWLKFSGKDVNKFLIIDINYQGDIPQI